MHEKQNKSSPYLLIKFDYASPVSSALTCNGASPQRPLILFIGTIIPTLTHSSLERMTSRGGFCSRSIIHVFSFGVAVSTWSQGTRSELLLSAASISNLCRKAKYCCMLLCHAYWQRRLTLQPEDQSWSARCGCLNVKPANLTCTCICERSPLCSSCFMCRLTYGRWIEASKCTLAWSWECWKHCLCTNWLTQRCPCLAELRLSAEMMRLS